MAVTESVPLRCAVCGTYWNDPAGVTVGDYLVLCKDRAACENRALLHDLDRHAVPADRYAHAP